MHPAPPPPTDGAPVGAIHVVVSRLRPDATAAAVAEAATFARALTAAPGVRAVLLGHPAETGGPGHAAGSPTAGSPTAERPSAERPAAESPSAESPTAESPSAGSAASAGALGQTAAGRGAALVVATLLDGERALDPFAASEPHMRFAVRGLSPVTAGVWTAAARIDPRDVPPPDAPVTSHGASPLGSAPDAAPDAAPGAAPERAPALWVCALTDDAALFDWQARRLLDRLRALPGRAWCGPTIEDRDPHRLAAAVLVDPHEAADFADALAELYAADATLAPLLRTAWAPRAQVLRP